MSDKELETILRKFADSVEDIHYILKGKCPDTKMQEYYFVSRRRKFPFEWAGSVYDLEYDLYHKFGIDCNLSCLPAISNDQQTIFEGKIFYFKLKDYKTNFNFSCLKPA